MSRVKTGLRGRLEGFMLMLYRNIRFETKCTFFEQETVNLKQIAGTVEQKVISV